MISIYKHVTVWFGLELEMENKVFSVHSSLNVQFPLLTFILFSFPYSFSKAITSLIRPVRPERGN